MPHRPSVSTHTLQAEPNYAQAAHSNTTQGGSRSCGPGRVRPRGTPRGHRAAREEQGDSRPPKWTNQNKPRPNQRDPGVSARVSTNERKSSIAFCSARARVSAWSADRPQDGRAEVSLFRDRGFGTPIEMRGAIQPRCALLRIETATPLSASLHDAHACCVSAGFARLADSSTARIRPFCWGFPRCSVRQAISR